MLHLLLCFTVKFLMFTMWKSLPVADVKMRLVNEVDNFLPLLF